MKVYCLINYPRLSLFIFCEPGVSDLLTRRFFCNRIPSASAASFLYDRGAISLLFPMRKISDGNRSSFAVVPTFFPFVLEDRSRRAICACSSPAGLISFHPLWQNPFFFYPFLPIATRPSPSPPPASKLLLRVEASRFSFFFPLARFFHWVLNL